MFTYNKGSPGGAKVAKNNFFLQCFDQNPKYFFLIVTYNYKNSQMSMPMYAPQYM